MAAIKYNPTAVAIQADQKVFQLYDGGVFNNPKCGTKIDHAVTAVGYGNDGTNDFYIVRNSWGASWGESGYIRIAAVDGDGVCGITSEAVSVWPKAS